MPSKLADKTQNQHTFVFCKWLCDEHMLEFSVVLVSYWYGLCLLLAFPFGDAVLSACCRWVFFDVWMSLTGVSTGQCFSFCKNCICDCFPRCQNMWTLFRLTPQSHTTAQRNRFMLFSSFFLGGFVGIKMGWTQETCESSKDMFQLPNFPVAMANRVLGGWISTWQLVWRWMWWHLPSFRPGAVDAATSKPRRIWANLFALGPILLLLGSNRPKTGGIRTGNSSGDVPTWIPICDKRSNWNIFFWRRSEDAMIYYPAHIHIGNMVCICDLWSRQVGKKTHGTEVQRPSGPVKINQHISKQWGKDRLVILLCWMFS